MANNRSHAQCDHPKTSTGYRACRKSGVELPPRQGPVNPRPEGWRHQDCDHPKTNAARRACNKGAEYLAAWMAQMDPVQQEAVYQRKRAYERRRNKTPEYRALKREYARKRLSTPEGRARVAEAKRKHRSTPKYRAREREKRATPEYLARQRERARKPENREKRRAYMTAKAIRRYRAKADSAVETIDSEKIFERDGWVCQLCGEEVDPLTFYPHPESPTLDHIVPLSLGGSHTENNVQLAHFRCNCSKGNRYEVAL